MSYVPAFAKAAINDVIKSIFSRLGDITRESGTFSYSLACQGELGGVDKAGNTMNGFIGLNVLKELLVMQRVGIYIDMPQLSGPTLVDKGNIHPYIYTYRTEQIRSWTYHPQDPELLTSIFLEEEKYDIDEETGLTKGVICNFRHMWLQDGGVACNYYNTAGELTDEPIFLDIDKIPFVMAELSASLMADIANYQIALMNLESSDLLYVLRNNFPFYVEQFDPRTDALYMKRPGYVEEQLYKNEKIVSAKENVEQITVGTSSGRRYPIGAERPAFINPSAEPLRASMDKARQMKADIRLLINLAIENLEPRRASAESKIADERPLESGLSYIGLELERVERYIGYFWSVYEGSKDYPVVKYPESYELKSDQDRKTETDNLTALIPQVNSKTYKKEAMKRIADITLGRHLPHDTLIKIKSEIDETSVVHSDPEVVTKDLENGLVGKELASKIRGYPKGEVEKAKQDHAEHIAIIAAAQTPGQGYGARGVKELARGPKEGKEEKQNAREDMQSSVPSDNGRGEGR